MTSAATSIPPADPIPMRPGPVERVQRIGFCLLVGVLLGFVLLRAVGATIQLQWPPEWDVLRDYGTAQVLLEGRYPEDPILVGKTLWYNPLTGAILALAHLVSGIPVARLGILLGPYLNLITPLGLVVLLARLFGRPAALAGMCLVLFGKHPANPFWVQLCYAPWLMAPLYAPGLMFLTMVVFYSALRRNTTTGHVQAGALQGITIGSYRSCHYCRRHHVVILQRSGAWLCLWPCCISGSGDIRGPGRQEEAGRLLGRFAVLLLAAFMVSLPYTWSILWNYGFHVRNPYPSLFAVDYVLLDQLTTRLREALNWRNGFALFGFGVRCIAGIRLPGSCSAGRLRPTPHGPALCYQALVAWNNVLLPGFAPVIIGPFTGAQPAALFAVGVATAGEGVVFLLGRALPAVPEPSS